MYRKPSGPNARLPAVVVGVRLEDEPRAAELQIEARRRVCDERVGGPLEARDDRVARRVGEVDEESAARRVVGRERKAEQPALAAGTDGRSQIEEVGWQHLA